MAQGLIGSQKVQFYQLYGDKTVTAHPLLDAERQPQLML